jgi:hypothetical protein
MLGEKWYDKIGTERERIVGGVVLGIFLTVLLFVFFYPSVPIEIEFHGKGNFTVPDHMLPNNMTFTVNEIEGRFYIIVPAAVYLKTITTLAEVYDPW